jgi:hypothetical protein
MKKLLILIFFSFSLSACAKKEKLQIPIFEVASINCKGDRWICDFRSEAHRAACDEISTPIEIKLSDGWRVITSSALTKFVSLESSISTSCVGTQYILEKEF